MPGLNQNSAVSGNYKIVDALKALGFLVASVVCVCVAVFFLLDFGSTPKGIAFASVVFILGFLIFKGFLVNAKGFIVDVEADLLEYPGGGIAAPSVFSYINPGYWLQHFKRYTLAISDIRHVDAYSQRNTKVGDDGKIRSTTTHYLDVNGEFGAISFSFLTKGKRDELYSLLVQLNEMGNPILNR